MILPIINGILALIKHKNLFPSAAHRTYALEQTWRKMENPFQSSKLSLLQQAAAPGSVGVKPPPTTASVRGGGWLERTARAEPELASSQIHQTYSFIWIISL